jgi:antirestriction protein
MINIYVGTYHKYNCGSIRGKWLELPLTDDELKNELDWVAGTETDPEFMIQDFETDFNIKIEECDNIEELNELARKTNNWSETQKEVFGCMVDDWGSDIEDACEKVEDCEYWYIEGNNDEELAQNYINELGGLDCLDRETLERYFDFEAFGRELSFRFTKTDNGYLADD